MKIVGHRGARGLAPENTIASLQKGLQHHADELEFDLRVTKDGVVVLHHNAHMHDLSGEHLLIAMHTYQELLAHKPDFATFQQVLTTIGRQVPLYMEVKPGEPVQPIVTIINACLKKGWTPQDFRLASFSQKTLIELHTELPEIPKIVNEVWSGVRAARRARQLGTKRISMDQRWLWSGFVSAMARGGYQLGAYPLNDPQKARRWAKRGLHAAITDYPDRFEKFRL